VPADEYAYLQRVADHRTPALVAVTILARGDDAERAALRYLEGSLGIGRMMAPLPAAGLPADALLPWRGGAIAPGLFEGGDM
jgi:hypothetical protein